MNTLLLALVLAAPIQEAPPKQESFVKLEKNRGTVIALKTAIVTYSKGDVTVDLVGAIHIGDKEYYRALNRQFVAYDALLYELVAPKDMKPQKGGLDVMGLVGKLALDLESQKERINYNKPNFIHADMSFEEMGEEMKKRGDSPITLGLRVAADLIQESNKPKKIDPLEALELAAVDNPLALKRYLAKQLAGKTTLLPSIEPIILMDRNAAAFRVLERELKNGRKKVGIFYGAAHLSDMQERLLKMGFNKKSETWLTAWNLEDDD